MSETTDDDEIAAPAHSGGGRFLAILAVIAVVVVVVGLVLVFASGTSKSNASVSVSSSVGPYILDQSDSTNPHNRDSHWHAALGVYDCDHWLGDATGNGIWQWPNVATIEGQSVPGRAGTNIYAGLHSHDDGIMHMEPATPDDAGANATVGRYFQEGGWQLSANGFAFLGTTRHNGDACGGSASQLRWFVNGREHSGDPGAYKLFDHDVVVIAFQPSDSYPGPPPSVANLPNVEVPTAPTVTPVAPASAAGKPCVAEKGVAPSGAPHVPVVVGPPPTKLVVRDLKVGTGAVVPKNATVVVNYIGVSCSTGRIFDSSWSRHTTFTAELNGGVISGWVDGLPGMRVGGERLLGIPPAAAYGAQGSPPVIAPNETLWFVVDVVRLGAN